MQPPLPFLYYSTLNPTHFHLLRANKVVLTSIKLTVSPTIIYSSLLPYVIVVEAWSLLDRHLNLVYEINLRSQVTHSPKSFQ